jgi:steroid 5-alpha reductase family enzyme
MAAGAYASRMTIGGSEYRVGRGLATTSRALGFAVVTAAYVLAGLAAWAVVAAVPDQHPLLVTFWADLAATVVVFGVSMAVGNSSLYDAYWSVAPPVIAVAWVVWAGGLTVRQAVVLLLVLVWAVRLTANWAVSWRGLSHEDWRYVQIRGGLPRRVPWWLVSLTGIQVMPTVVVFLGMLAVWPAVTVAGRSFGVLDVLAVVVTAAAIATEALADRQLYRFAADPANRGRIIDRGLWRYSRHPNYLGEIGFWWGMWLFGLAAAPGWWWTVVGPVAMVLLFTFVSVPMMDRRSIERRPAYEEHMRRVPAIVPSLVWRRPSRASSETRDDERRDPDDGQGHGGGQGL